MNALESMKLACTPEIVAELYEALEPFAELIHRKWDEGTDGAIALVARGGSLSELQAIDLGHVIKAVAALKKARGE